MGWLAAGPASIATLRAVALLLRAIRAAWSTPGDGPPCLSADASLPVMILLEPNLASASRLLRLSTARVLARYNPLRFGEDSGRSVGGSTAPLNRQQQHQREGPCNFLEIVEALEALPISIAAERDLMWRLGQLEVLGRSSRLPRPYAALMSTHALALMRVKFSGVWPRAAAIIGALCQRPDQRELVWEAVEKALRKVMPPPPTRPQATSSSMGPQEGEVVVVATVEAANGAAETTLNRGAGSGTAKKSGSDKDNDSNSANDCAARGEDDASSGAPPFPKQQQPSRLGIAAAPRPKPWVPRLLSEAALFDGGPMEEIDLPVALEGVFLDESVRTGLQPESGEVPLWASTDADSAFTQVRSI